MFLNFVVKLNSGSNKRSTSFTWENNVIGQWLLVCSGFFPGLARGMTLPIFQILRITQWNAY